MYAVDFIKKYEMVILEFHIIETSEKLGYRYIQPKVTIKHEKNF